jgi:hypothetical protein
MGRKIADQSGTADVTSCGVPECGRAPALWHKAMAQFGTADSACP